jgi:hypothetical protein
MIDLPLKYNDPMMIVQTRNGHPPTKLIVTSVVKADKPLMILRPKWSERLLSMPTKT